MSLLVYKSIAALLIFLVSVLTAFYPLKKKNHHLEHAESMVLGEALASGIFLGAAFFHLLPDAIRTFQHLYPFYSYPLPECICVLGFLFLLLLERLSFTRSSTPHYSIPYILAIMLTVHAVVEGTALGIGSTFSEALMLFIAILAHKGSESFALCVAMLRQEIPSNRVLKIVLFFALMTPLGIAIGSVVNLLTYAEYGELAAAIFNAFAAGTFLYISTLHHIHFHKHDQDGRGLLEMGSLILGTVMMGVIAIWA